MAREYVPPTQRDNIAPALKKATGAGYSSPFALSYQGSEHAIGEEWRFRIISLAKDDIREFKTREVTLTGKDGKPFQKRVFDPGHPHNTTLFDHAGVCLADGEEREVYRIPIFVISHTDARGKVMPSQSREDFFKFLEFTAGINKEIHSLAATAAGSWNSKTGRPEYDIILRIVKGKSARYPKNYELEIVTINPDTKKADDSYGVVFEEYIGDEMFDALKEMWGDLQTAMDHGLTLEDTRRALKRFSDDDGADKAPERSVSRKFAARANEPTEEPEPEAQAPQQRRFSASVSAETAVDEEAPKQATESGTVTKRTSKFSFDG